MLTIPPIRKARNRARPTNLGPRKSPIKAASLMSPPPMPPRDTTAMASINPPAANPAKRPHNVPGKESRSRKGTPARIPAASISSGMTRCIRSVAAAPTRTAVKTHPAGVAQEYP